ncbi:uncharacterized protein BDR25DRAFT_347359 [Lindgomyces ingoldianus]|uniref:Uncharacterized protein n=1 Tax=Lindgomyces ingoldianus TaxID=673940 RepID=A0ACB6Q890_9PLEO|nr:uncharacterized protein BDR25DRAFT_347359 [Lindgomyces ingoldianus]KAF2463128.1 hypothetical protein BDR25DRAFT_347359 [Lindgomyces ingoldianus]
MSECSASLSDQQETQPPKRKAAQAGLDGNTTGRSVKRRASKACQCCRARKVRCNVTEHGAPCTNCRLDEVECIVSESRRKKKWTKDDDNHAGENTSSVSSVNRKLASREALDSIQNLTSASSRRSHEAEPRLDEHVPHSIYQTHGSRLNSINSFSELHRRLSVNSQATTNGLPIMPFASFTGDARTPFYGNVGPKTSTVADLPLYIKPLPARIGPDEVAYLEKKGALTVPKSTLRNEMLRAYVEFVHPYMPLLDLHDFLPIVDRPDGSLGKASLILFQAVMFAGSAFVDMRHLRNAGYATRKEARKDFFQKTRLLYDFDYESDRVSLVQSLLLLTYYYETPDDQKDTWHWMGVATSVAHTIGLHRNPDKTNMDTKRTRLWKRIWWSTYMRDRLIALGMRRPTRIKTEDFDVPMLTLDDFELAPIPDTVTCLPPDCRVAFNVKMQRELAIMCIEKAKLCLCISHVLSKQYCVLNNNQGLMNDRTTMMLLPKKLDPETGEVKACDEELQKWVNELPEEAKYTDKLTGENALDLHRALLHMVFFTTLSALHRPQVLPSSHTAPTPTDAKQGLGHDFLDVSRRNVRRAASAITSIAQRLDSANLVKFLPTTGVTVLLPAIIIHLLDIKAPEEETRRSSLRGFCQCMAVMGKLRDLYAAADYSTAFLEAAIRKAGIHIAPMQQQPLAKPSPVTTVEDLVDAGRRLDLAHDTPTSQHLADATRTTLTPPPDNGTTNMTLLEKISGPPGAPGANVTDEEVARRLESFLASTPPESDHDHDNLDAITISQDSDGHSHTHSHHIPTTNSHPHTHTLAHAHLNHALKSTSELNYTGFASDLPPNPFNHHHDSETLFSSLPMNHDFDDGDFDSLLNLDAVGEAFAWDEGALENGLQISGEMGMGMGGGDADWFGGGGGGVGVGHLNLGE